MNRKNIYLIAYDISDNKRRTRIAKLLEKYGYERIQFSVFTGLIPPYKYIELWDKLLTISEPELNPNNKIICFAITKSAFRNMQIIGIFNADIDYITGVKITEII